MCELLKYKTLFGQQRHKSHKASLAALIRQPCKLARSRAESQWLRCNAHAAHTIYYQRFMYAWHMWVWHMPQPQPQDSTATRKQPAHPQQPPLYSRINWQWAFHFNYFLQRFKSPGRQFLVNSVNYYAQRNIFYKTLTSAVSECACEPSEIMQELTYIYSLLYMFIYI